LWARRFTAWLARFSADLILAKGNSAKTVQKNGCS